jgi:hypothetical protein
MLKILMLNPAQMQKEEECQRKNFYYLYIVDTKDASRHSSIVLKGYINHHVQVCP